MSDETDPVGATTPEFGPFHRLQSPSQTAALAALQVDTGEVWGRAARGSDFPSVKAYRGPLPDGERGLEFMTTIAPSVNPHPTLVLWYEGQLGVRTRSDGFVSIDVRITKVR